MYDRLTTVFANAGAEAEALNLVASLPPAPRAFLAATSHAEATHRPSITPYCGKASPHWPAASSAPPPAPSRRRTPMRPRAVRCGR